MLIVSMCYNVKSSPVIGANKGLLTMSAERVENRSLGERKRLIEANFEINLRNTVRELVSLDGVSFDELPPWEQREHELGFLRDFYSEKDRQRTLEHRPSERGNWLDEQIKVNPNPIELTILNQSNHQEQKLRLGADHKGMFAFFAVLTRQKISRFLDPWITREELASYTGPHYTLSQLDRHLFKPFKKIGIFEASYGKGYRLTGDSSNVLQILQGDEPYHQLEILGFEKWFRAREPLTILVEDYHLPLVSAILTRCEEASSLKEYLDIELLHSKIGLSEDRIYDSLRELEKLGLVKREGDKYRIGDVNRQYIDELVKSQEKPIAVNVKLKELPSAFATIESRQATSLEIQQQEEFDFPKVSWQESNVETIDIGQLSTDRERMLSQLDQILTCDLQPTTVWDKDGHYVYSGKLPSGDSLSKEEVIGVLDFFGFGPEELKSIQGTLDVTLAAAMRELEASSQLKDKLLVAEMKTRLAGLIIDEVIPGEEGEEMPFAKVMSLLDDVLIQQRQELEPAPVTIYPAEIAQVPIKPKPIEKPLPAIHPGLLEVIQKPFEKEFLSAVSQPSAVFIDPLPPTAAFNYHRILSNKSTSIPWENLINLGLAQSPKADHHPRLTPPGALVASLFLTHDVHNRVSVLTHSESRSIQTIARYCTHLFKDRLGKNGPGQEKETKYIENCLKILFEAGLTCQCEECQRLS